MKREIEELKEHKRALMNMQTPYGQTCTLAEATRHCLKEIEIAKLEAKIEILELLELLEESK